MHELEVVTPAAAWTVHRARALKRAPQVAGPLGRGARGPGEPQLLGRLYRRVTLGAHRVAGAAEPVWCDRREPRFHSELCAPQAHDGAGDRRAWGAQGDTLVIPYAGGVDQACKNVAA